MMFTVIAKYRHSSDWYLNITTDWYLNMDAMLSKKCLPLETIKSMYKSLVELYFRYCIPVWGSFSTTTLDKIQNLQNTAAIIVKNSQCDMPSLPLIKGPGWPTIIELIDIETAKIVFKSLQDSASIYMIQIFQWLSDTSLRQLGQLQLTSVSEK